MSREEREGKDGAHGFPFGQVGDWSSFHEMEIHEEEQVGDSRSGETSPSTTVRYLMSFPQETLMSASLKECYITLEISVC